MDVPIRFEDGAATGGLAPVVPPGEQHYAAAKGDNGTIILKPIDVGYYQTLRIQAFAREQLGLDLLGSAVRQLVEPPATTMDHAERLAMTQVVAHSGLSRLI